MARPAGPVAWDVAERVARRVARTSPPMDANTWSSLESDFSEFTERAEEIVSKATGLHSLAGPARAKVTDRPGWVSANVASFQRLLAPLLERAEERPPPLLGILGPGARMAAGAELGLLLGWMSGRVVGQYDLLLTEEANLDEDLVYYVGPNVLALERRYAFPPREFRLWIALHEVTHRLQFTGVPWLRGYFLELVERGMSLATPDPGRILEALRSAASAIRAGRNPLEEAGLVGVLATGEQLEALRHIQALMSLLEGHGEVTMNRAGEEQVPGAQRFSKVLRARRQEARGAARLLQQLVGLEAKLRQYADGERFIETIERAGGAELLAVVWRGPEMLPTFEEIRDPGRWIARVSGPAVASA